MECLKRISFLLVKSIILLCVTEAFILPDPEGNFTAEDLIIKYGYAYEEHLIESPDGIISPLQRVSHGPLQSYSPNRIPVLMFHGLFTTGRLWVSSIKNRSLAFTLVDNGYDVWLVNARGSTYTNHYNKKVKDNPEYWNYSFQEMALIDTPVLIDYILNKTGHKKLFFVGISMGTTVGFILLSTKPEYNNKIHAFLALSPIAYMTYSSNGLFLLAGYVAQVEQRNLGNTGSQPFTFAETIRDLIIPPCEKLKIFRLCVDILFGSFGDRISPEDEMLIPGLLKLFSEYPSVKTVLHFYQFYTSGKFQMYDYENPEENMKKYNQTTPPEFNLSAITVPVGLYPPLYDTLGDPKDIQKLATRLRNLQFNSPLLNAKGDGHVSSLGARGIKYNFPNIIKFMKSISPQPQS